MLDMGEEGGWSGDGQPLELFTVLRGKPIERVDNGKNTVSFGKHELHIYYIQNILLVSPNGSLHYFATFL